METRYRIYRLLVVEDKTQELTSRKQTRTFRVPAVLHVNKQIREEASHVWYGLNHFCLTVKHGETALVRGFLSAIASLQSPLIGRLDINLSICYQCNDLVAVAALLIASNTAARLRCMRGLYHFGHPQIQSCNFDIKKAILDQHFRPSVATALLQFSDARQVGAGFVIEETIHGHPASTDPLIRSTKSVLGYTPTYRTNPAIRSQLEQAMGSLGLLLR
ncbi:hypothetical protein AAFC00_006563 [Neodothiora populina]